MQLNTEFPRHFALVAIFLTPVSLCKDLGVTGVIWILSIMLILGASRIALGRDNAHCMLHIERGLIYISDRKCPPIVHASGVWNQYLHGLEKENSHSNE